MTFNVDAWAELAPIIAFVALFILAVCVAIAIAIREKESTITNEREKDFLDRFAQKKKAQLSNIPGSINFKTYMAILCIAPIVLGAAAFIFTNSPIAIVAGIAVGLIAPELIVKLNKSKSAKDFDERYGRALRQMASTLRSGMTVQQAVEEVSQNPFLDKSTKDMFVQINSDIKVGVPVGEAFNRAVEINNTCDTRDMAAAMAMQTEVGGSEAEVVDIVSTNINKRIMLRKEINTLFTTSKLTVYTMDIAPPILLFIVVGSGGDIMDFYFENIGNTLILVGIFVLMLIGSVISHKMMNKSKVSSE